MPSPACAELIDRLARQILDELLAERAKLATQPDTDTDDARRPLRPVQLRPATADVD